MFDMREYIQDQLDLWDLGNLIWVEGPEVTKRQGEDYYELVVKYRPHGNEKLSDPQFYDGRISINIGYSRKGGYWNRRCIRLAIRAEGLEKREEQHAQVVWSSAQKALTTGRDDDGAFAL